MPLFDFKCKECGEVFEVLVRGEANIVCPKCGQSDAEKVLSNPAVHFKGQGWTKTSIVDRCDPATVQGVTKVENPRPDQTVLHGKESTVKKLRKLL